MLNEIHNELHIEKLPEAKTWMNEVTRIDELEKKVNLIIDWCNLMISFMAEMRQLLKPKEDK